MRLTLRTLLAYMDDILEPAQAKEIGQKINESEFATELVKRIREVMRRRRISAPEATGPGAGIDPNLVSEYLDNLLAPSAVTEVERICLDADVQLAEVASCHQILTLVMGDPIDVSKTSRQRMYALGPVDDGAAASVAPLEVESKRPNSKVAPAKPAASFADTVPDYLKRKPMWRRVFPFVCVMAILGVWLYLVFSDDTIVGPASTDVAQTETDSGESDSGGATPADSSQESDADGAPIAPQRDDAATPSASDEGIDPAPPADEPGTGLANTVRPSVTVTPVVPLAGTNTNGTDADSVTPNGTNNVPSTGLNTEEPTTTNAATNTNPNNPNPANAANGVQAVTDPTLVNETGDGVLLAYAEQLKDFEVVERDIRLTTGSVLCAPEPFIGKVRVEGVECVIELLGGTRAVYMGASEAGRVGFGIEQGRVVFKGTGLPLTSPEGDPGFAFYVQCAGQRYRLELLTDATECAIEVIPRQPVEPLEDFGRDRFTGRIIVVSGAIRFSDGQQVQVVNRNQSMVFKAGGPVPATDEGETEPAIATPALIEPQSLDLLPQWLQPQSRELSAIVRRSVTQFQEAFIKNEPVSASIAPLIRDPNPRIAELAVKCLGLTHDVRYLVSTLQQSAHEEARLAAIEAIRNWLPLAPEHDEQLKSELENQFPGSNDLTIHRLLWGYGPADAANRFIALSLVDGLEHEHIAVRELAFYYIRRLSPRKFEYRPNASPIQRAAAVKRLRDQVSKDGHLPGVESAN